MASDSGWTFEIVVERSRDDDPLLTPDEPQEILDSLGPCQVMTGIGSLGDCVRAESRQTAAIGAKGSIRSRLDDELPAERRVALDLSLVTRGHQQRLDCSRDNLPGSDRGPNGEPSSTDFIVIDLPTVVDEFTENFATLPIAYSDCPDYRVLVVGGTLVAASVVVGQPVANDSIVLLGIELDLDWPDEQVDKGASRSSR